MAFIYDCQIYDDIFNPIGIFDKDMKCYQDMVKFPNILLNSPTVLKNGKDHLDLILIKLHTWNYLIPNMYPLNMDNLSCF